MMANSKSTVRWLYYALMKLYRKIFEIEGIVQGVGFRPAIYCLAVDAGLGGWIQNCSGKVLLALEGEDNKIDDFIASLPENLPKQARIDGLHLVESNLVEKISKFSIRDSDQDSVFKVSIPADLAMCSDCEKEISDPSDRRYRYPFTTCVNCGPRYTVVNSMPYDRRRTTLSEFPLCPECEKEYTDPRNRRFHAESTACPVCGPQLFLTDSTGKKIESDDPLKRVIAEISNGKIVAIRGIGGFLLAVDASNRDAIIRLRERKTRPDKPFAVMARDMNSIKKQCKVNAAGEEMLKSVSAPIVILDTVVKPSLPMDLITPDTDTLGVMLPYSPLHKLLFEARGLEFLVMTSGNRGGEPICIKNEEAFERLSGIADYILCHDREINLRNDDSVCTLQDGDVQMWRRARGFAPEAIKTDLKFNKTVLAMGAELKNCIALAYDKEVVVSPHIGDLETPEAVDGLRSVAKCFPDFLKKQPEIVAVDLHPDMHSTRIGVEIANKLNVPVVKVQHHHAHAAACMAENGLKESLALVFDGTGFGTDGTIWGAELLYVDEDGFSRLATFSPVPLPGGDAAVYHPARQLVGRYYAAGIEMTEEMLENYDISRQEYEIWKAQCEKGINAPLTHAAGRLFDSFAVLAGVSPASITYEGQGAIRLEAEAKRAMQNNEKLLSLPFDVIEKNDMLYVDWSELFRRQASGIGHQELRTTLRRFSSYGGQADHGLLALSFHKAVVSAAVKMLEFGLGKVFTRNVVLTGGVFMNKILTSFMSEEIKCRGLNAYTHKKIPPNDGGISVGQTVIAN